MNTKKYSLSLMMCFVLLITMISGCGTNSDSDKTARSNDGQKASGEGSGDKAAEKMKLKFWTYYPEQTKIDGSFMNFLKNKFDVDADFYVASSDTQKEKLNLAIASGDFPDWWKSLSFQEYTN